MVDVGGYVVPSFLFASIWVPSFLCACNEFTHETLSRTTDPDQTPFSRQELEQGLLSSLARETFRISHESPAKLSRLLIAH